MARVGGCSEDSKDTCSLGESVADASFVCKLKTRWKDQRNLMEEKVMRQSKLIMITFVILLVSTLVVGCDGKDTSPTQSTSPPPAPASFSISNLSIEPAQVEANETITISLTVANTGGTQGSDDVVLNINGAQEETQSVTIAPGASQSIAFSVTREEVGNYTVSVDGLTGNFTVSPPPPAEFQVSNLTVTPSEVEVDEEFVVSVEVANTGGSEGTYAAILEINGEAVETKNVVVGAGGTETVSFELTQDAPGLYTASLDGLTSTFKVGVELIAFDSNRDGDREIYVMNADGSNVAKLTDNTASDRSPSLSPDGRKIAFYSNRDGVFEIYVMNVDGSNVVNLTNNTTGDVYPSWSPDGQKIAFVSGRDGDEEIYVMNADGSNVVKLTDNTALDRIPSWSPDGQKIVFVSNRDGDYEIYVMNADGSNVVKLTDNTALDIYPSWSPDGQKIAFASNRDGDYEIYVMNADGSNVVKLTDNAAYNDYNGSWSPDGQKIAFHSDRDGDYEIYVMNADGSNVVKLTDNAASDIGPSWALGSFAIAEQVTFPDSNLEAAIREAINKPQGPITAADLESLRSLDTQGRGISDLTGLEYCLNLQLLNLDGNNISDLSPLAGLTDLVQLFLDSNNISDISTLAGLTNLELIWLSHNNISDISALANLTNLVHLKLDDNNIRDISALVGLTNLEFLSLMNNDIRDISPLVENTGLASGDYLYLYNNPLLPTSVDVYIPQLEARGVEVKY